ncbi:altronate dehydratase family protein [Parabacteroides sp. OttesenSCG-928-G21]|nr:altronate dehydratase family protein [Parabacteroides sp. OttesenSCG-928-G21]
MMHRFIRINSGDNVLVAIADLKKGEALVVADKEIVLKEDIPSGHKIALYALSPGDQVIKYGYPIGHVVKRVFSGEWVNEHNLHTNLGEILQYSYNPQYIEKSTAKEGLTFQGYLRKNGDAGIRNEIWIVPTVGCVNGIVNRLAEKLRTECRNTPEVDAVVAFPHNYGCSQLGDDHDNTRRILRNIVLHPNAGGVLVVGLGCENNQLESFREMLGDYDKERICFMETQKVEDEIEAGMQLLRKIKDKVLEDRRVELPLEKIRIGLKCGGSDGFSGITANPLIGRFSDFWIAAGGTTVLTEVPEMFGAEKILMDRCNSKVVFEKMVALINDFKHYFQRNDQPIYENPSPGNKAGGISTLEEKSLGCTQKSGSSPIVDVLTYGERIQKNGLNLLSAPGNDMVACTALAASGCQVILFSTGRGTPLGAFVPTIKIATNTDLFHHKPLWIDFDSGSSLAGESMEKLCDQFVSYVISVLNGTYVNNEKNGYRDIGIFKSGVTL